MVMPSIWLIFSLPVRVMVIYELLICTVLVGYPGPETSSSFEESFTLITNCPSRSEVTVLAGFSLSVIFTPLTGEPESLTIWPPISFVVHIQTEKLLLLGIM